MTEKTHSNNTQNEKIICVVGPTAAGKSDLALKICKKFVGEIISCDSMQIYRKMDVGTAKPSKEEMQSVKHHLVDIIDIKDSFSVSDYVDLAEKCVKDIISRNKLPVFCGGTGLYIDSFVDGINFGEYESLPEYRKELEEYAEKNGKEALWQMLSSVDVKSAENINFANVKRVIRALEVYKATGKPISFWNERAKENAVKKNALYIGVSYADREILYDKINKRVDKMMENGLEKEARALYESGLEKTETAGQAIGYKEFYPYFKGQASLEECVERLKINSRHYAKRQLTWFSRNKSIIWLYRDGKDDVEKAAFDEIDAFLHGKNGKNQKSEAIR
ncbi:MAG: tRNA (adenosine(37)-N6)-dimethylallyltransferase MiaA [Clostridia bacterium]|nr:tRNA (adenosine(37)-N6)-dimethylallyltransferase MiaA [Clostridia bacterium]